MKTVKISITVPKPLYEFAEKRAQERARAREERPNISSVFKELLLNERERMNQKKAA